ncbi:MAG: polyprenyl synthetase family protein, partial [Candidatus Kapaibacteriota bacterium]
MEPIAMHSTAFDEKFSLYRQHIDEFLLQSHKGGMPEVLYDPMEYILSAGGKRLRPIITMLACESIGGSALSAAGCGAALEILHNFTLVHDDIMDKSPLRRGRETVHVKWDEASAILSGDAMMGIAYRLLINEVKESPRGMEILSRFTQGLIDVCEGQARDLEFQQTPIVSMDEYLSMIEMKTARLIELSAIVGALYANANAEQIKALLSYAYHLGIAFQVQDDILDLLAENKEFGKAIGQDLIEGKKSFFIVRAYECIKDGADAEFIQQYIAQKGITNEQIPIAIDLFKRHGIIEDAVQTVQSHVHAAQSVLSLLPKNEGKLGL